MIGNDTKLKVGLATFAQPTFDVPWAESIRAKTVDLLQSLDVDVVAFEKPLMYENEAYEFRKKLRQEEVDVVILQTGGFSFGGLPIIIGTEVHAPLVIWSTPEPDWDGGPIRSNSLCAGIMHNSHLKSAGINPQFIYGAPEDKETVESLKAMLKALVAVKVLKTSKLGIVGHRAPGFYSSGFDEMKLQSTLGVEVFHIDISTVFSRMASFSDEAADAVIEQTGLPIDESAADSRTEIRKTVKVYLSLKEIAAEQSIDALAVKCWPDFPTEQGIMVCMALGMLNNDGIRTACEADVYGAVTMLVQDWLGAGPEFFNDLIQVNQEENQALYWHCGAAPLSLVDENADAAIMPHAMRGVPTTVNAPLKTGRVTVSRLSEDGAGWKMFLTTGEAVQTPQLLRGNPSLVKMDIPVQKMLDTVIEEGFEHHYSTIYGDIAPEMEWFCKFLGIRMVRP